MNANVSATSNAIADVLSTYSGNATAASRTSAIDAVAYADGYLRYDGAGTITATTYSSPYEQILKQLRELQSDIEEIKESLRLLQSASLQKVEELV